MSRAWIRKQLHRFGEKSTHLVALCCGERFPFWYVSEYPKSGGTWLARMIADYLMIPFPQVPLLPVGMQCVIHNHWRYSSRLNRVFYIYRDGRDVMTSFYFRRMYLLKTDSRLFSPEMARRYERAFGKRFDPHDSRKHMPRFIELEMTRPRGCRINWPNHIEQWFRPDRDGITFLSYEQLLNDPLNTLKHAFERFLDQDVDERRLQQTIERFSFENMTARKPGQEDRRSFIRKAVAGDWKNHFTREAAEVFNHYAGDTLVMLGYEADASWVEEVDSA